MEMINLSTEKGITPKISISSSLRLLMWLACYILIWSVSLSSIHFLFLRERDREEVLAKLETKGPSAAMLHLVLTIPYRNKNWHHVLLSVLDAHDYRDIRSKLVSAAKEAGNDWSFIDCMSDLVEYNGNIMWGELELLTVPDTRHWSALVLLSLQILVCEWPSIKYTLLS